VIRLTIGLADTTTIDSLMPFSESLPAGFEFRQATNAPLAMHMTQPLALILPPGKVGPV